MNFVFPKTIAELLGTFWLVFGGCEAAVFAGTKIGFAEIALGFGLTLLTGIYAFWHISSGHFNPAVTLGLWAAGRFDKNDILPYIIAQFEGAMIACLLIWIIQMDGTIVGKLHFATNGYGDFSPEQYGMTAGAITEIVLTFVSLLVICGTTNQCAPAGFAPLAIGLSLTLIHLIGIPVTNLSVSTPPEASVPQSYSCLQKIPMLSASSGSP